MINIGVWQLDLSHNELRRGEERVALEPLAAEVLAHLARHADRVVSTEELVESLWNRNVVGDSPVYRIVADLRRALGDQARQPRYIQTVRKRGYRLIADVDLDTTALAEQPTPSSTATAAKQTPPHAPAVSRHIALTLVLAVTLAGVLWWWKSPNDPVREELGKGVPIIAVLPFEDLGQAKNHSAFAHGMHDDLLTQLSTVKGWRVISRTSVQRYRNTEASIQQIAAALDASVIVEGAVQHAADQLRINIQVIDGKNDEHLWAETYTKNITENNIFATQNDIASAVVKELVSVFAFDHFPSTPTAPVPDINAYTLYAKGKKNLAIRSVQSLTEATSQFKQSIEIAPDFALAHAALAEAYLLLGDTFFGGLGIAESITLAEPHILKAIELNPNIAEAVTALGAMHMLEKREQEASKTFERALDLQPSHTPAYYWYSKLKWRLFDYDEAMALAKTAYRLDPFSASINLSLGRMYDQLGQFDQAMTHYIRVTKIEPNNALAPVYIAAIKFLQQGKVAESLVWYHKAATKDKLSPSMAAGPAVPYLELGDVESARYFVKLANSLEPNSFWARWTSLLINYHENNDTKVLNDAKLLLQRYPLNWAALHHLRNHDLKNGKPLLAKARYEASHPELTALKEPEVNTGNLFAAIDLALVLQEVGEDKHAAKILDRAEKVIAMMERGGTNGYWINDVKVYALQNRPDKAIAALEQAIEGGWRLYTWYYLDRDPTLDSLKSHPKFSRLRERLQRDLDRQAEQLSSLRTSGQLVDPGFE